MASCDNRVDINLPGEPVHVAYCILDTHDSIQKIKLSRSYLPDSEGIGSNYNNIDNYDEYSAFIEEMDSGDRFNFFYEDIILDSSGSAAFLIMKTECWVKPGSAYKLVVNDGKDKVLEGITRTVGSLEVLDPIELPGRELTITTGQGYMLRWAPAENARVYQPVVYFNYVESGDATSLRRQVRIPLRININDEKIHNITQFMSGGNFYRTIADNIKRDGKKRVALSLDFEIMAGGEELSVYIGQETDGISDFGQLEAYSNLEGGKGIFSSRCSVWVRNVELSYITLDSLALNPITIGLGFEKSGL
jgi:hypothetical protein